MDGGTQVISFILNFAVFGASGTAHNFPNWGGNGTSRFLHSVFTVLLISSTRTPRLPQTSACLPIAALCRRTNVPYMYVARRGVSSIVVPCVFTESLAHFMNRNENQLHHLGVMWINLSHAKRPTSRSGGLERVARSAAGRVPISPSQSFTFRPRFKVSSASIEIRQLSFPL